MDELQTSDTYIIACHKEDGTHTQMYGHPSLLLELIGGLVHILVSENDLTIEQALEEIRQVNQEYEDLKYEN